MYANVSADWVDGNLVVKDKAGATILTVDGASRKVTIPAGSAPELPLASDGNFDRLPPRVRARLRHCRLELKAEFDRNLRRKPAQYLGLAQELAWLLLDRAILDAPITGASYAHLLSEASLKKLRL